MKGKWLDTAVYPNVRWCSNCNSKVGSNKEKFDFKFCPYCGDRKTGTFKPENNTAFFASIKKKTEKESVEVK